MKTKLLLIAIVVLLLAACNGGTNMWQNYTLEEAEVMIAEKTGPLYAPGFSRLGLIDLIEGNDETLSFDFNKLQELGLKVFTSNSSNFRVYTWRDDISECKLWTILQWKTSKSNRVYTKCCYSSDDWYEVVNIKEVQYHLTKEPYYLICYSNRNCPILDTQEFKVGVVALKVTGNRIERANIFSNGYQEDSCLERSIGIINYDLAEFSNNDWYEYMFYLSEEKNLYVPANSMCGYMFGDLYEEYYLEGDKFEYQRSTSGASWLNEELIHFDHMLLYVETETHSIRIDLLKDNSIRYSSWRQGKTMSEEPDIILYDGLRTENGDYVFYNNGYKYVYDDLCLKIYYNGRLLRSEEYLIYM